MAQNVSDILYDGWRPANTEHCVVSKRRSGFSFVEILFAVMILGIGFIMIAGVFPVAINQTQANGDETISASMARQATATISNLPNTALYMTADNTVHRFGPLTTSFNDADTLLWRELGGSQILSEDPRYAWVPFYYRAKDSAGLASNVAQLIIIGVRVRNHDAYVPSAAAGGDLAITSGTGPTAVANLIGKPVLVQLIAGKTFTDPDEIFFFTQSASTVMNAVAPGTFVIIANDQGATPTNSAVGWILKVGNPDPARGNLYFLQPGGDMKNSTLYKPSSHTSLNAFFVGQGTDPENTNAYTGGTQDIMAYTTFVPVH